MSYLSPFSRIVRPMLSYLSPESLGTSLRTAGGTPGCSSGAWPTANKAIYCPFVLNQAILVKKLWTANGTNASQTRDIGIFDVNGVKIVSSGSTAGSGTSTLQVYDVTDTIIGPGIFYIGLSSSGTTNQFFSNTGTSISALRRCGVFEETSAFALPATATFATIASNYLPLCGLSTVVTV